MPESPPDLADLAGRLIGRGVSSATFIPLDDEALVGVVESLTLLRHEVERCQAIAAAEVARRSTTRFGVRGLSQRAGHASTGDLLQSITRSSKRDTAALVEVGRMIAETDAAAELERARRADPTIAVSVPNPRRRGSRSLEPPSPTASSRLRSQARSARASVSLEEMPTTRCSRRSCRP